MTLEIHTSQFWDGADQNGFENAVQDYIHTLHAFNMVVGKPRPTAVHPLIEKAVMEKILPARRIRLAHIKYNDALSLDETVRTAEHQKDIELITTVQGFRNQYALIAAQAEADIDDLTEQTIDSWQ